MGMLEAPAGDRRTWEQLSVRVDEQIKGLDDHESRLRIEKGKWKD